MAKFAAFTCVLLLTVFNRSILARESHIEEEESVPVAPKPIYVSPVPTDFTYLAENFDDIERFNKTWIISEAKKEDTDEDIAKYDGRFLG